MREGESSTGLSSGTALGELTIERVLGRGGTATVYAARRADGTLVAVKVLHLDLAVSARARARLLRESYAANRLASQGGVAMLGHGEHDGAAYLVMEFLEGETLGQRARRGLSLHALRELVLALLDVLERAHRAGVVHRDIKPENVFLTATGEVRVLDFGLAALAETPGELETISQRSFAMGTPAFMPPELARGRSDEADARTDVWQVGALFFTLASGQHVHRAETAAEYVALSATQPARALSSAMPRVSRQLAAVVDRALAFERSQRWKSAAEFADALRAADLTDVTPPAGLATQTETTRSPRSSRWLGLAAALLAVSIGAGAAFSSSPRRAVPTCDDVDAAEFFVEPTGIERCSFTSITTALRAAERSKAPHKTIRLGPGRYSPMNTGERYPLELRGNLSIVGAGMNRTILEGVGELSHREEGGAITDDVLEATLRITGHVELRDLSLRPDRNKVQFHSFGVFCEAGNATRQRPLPEPNLIVERVRFGPNYDSGLLVTNVLHPIASGCNARVKDSVFFDNAHGVFAIGCGAGQGEQPVAVDVASSDFVNQGIGVLAWGCVTTTRVTSSRFIGGDVGVQFDQRTPPASFADGYVNALTDNRFERQVSAIQLWRAAHIELEGNVIEGAQVAVVMDPRQDDTSPSLRARGNVFRDNERLFAGSAKRPSLDFGTNEEPGNNELRCTRAELEQTWAVAGAVGNTTPFSIVKDLK